MNKKLLDALVEELPDKLGAIFGLRAGGRACSTFSRLLAEILGEFGIASEVRSVYVETANQAGIDYLQGKISFEEAMKIGGKIQVLGDIRMSQDYQHAVCYISVWNVIVDLTTEPRLSKLVPMHPYWAEWGQLPWWIRGFEFRDYPLEYRVYETRPAEVKRAKEVIRDIVRRLTQERAPSIAVDSQNNIHVAWGANPERTPRFSEAIDMIQGGLTIDEVVKAGVLTVEQADMLLPTYKKILANRHLLKLDTDVAIKEAVLGELSGKPEGRKPLYPHVPKKKEPLYPHRTKSQEKMPRIDPHASALKQDKQLREQRRWLKEHGFETAREAQEAGY